MKKNATDRLLSMSAQEIVKLLRSKGWTLAEIAAQLGSQKQHAYDISTGRRGVGEEHLRTLQRLAVDQDIL